MKHVFLLSALLLWTSTTFAQTICVFDMSGTQGPLMSAMREYSLAAKTWQADIKLRAYVDERVATEDFKAGQCDGALLTGIRARAFNSFTGSIDSVGALPDYGSLKSLLQTLSRPEAAALLRQQDHEIGGILPLGAAYLFIRDRRIDSLAKMAGRRIATLDHDRTQLRMAERIGAQAVSADVTNFAGKFNNGVVDVAVAPGIAYEPLELYKGVGTKGVVLKMPVAQLTLQLILKPAAFPAGFSQHSREYFFSQFDNTLARINDAESLILFFFPPPDGDAQKYGSMLREARIDLTAEGFYDKRMMTLMKKVRCKRAPAAPECTESRE
jgi:hypothetical protein